MFNKVLIANRGEIACRIIRSCRRLGIASVAVYSEADAGARHVAEADERILLGPASAAESYLRADRIVQVALDAGADAIHPGYGFLSEKLELIDACAASGIAFIGPHRAAIAAMGSKIESKRLARAAGVACVPGYDGDDQQPATLRSEAARIGFPLLIKASAGGGGKGMRRVDRMEDFDALLALARKEAQAAFGDERVLLEKFIARPRHLEVQLMGDRHGALVHLFERECSIQRRFQKLIEEAPANHLPEAVADRLYAAALRIGRAIGYDNAGTVEFVLDADGGDTPWFLEVNTRLQVEHPVTELTTGIDLVEWQLRVAAGEPLPLAQEQIRRRGWAIECRLNAEEPEFGFRASLGTVAGYAEPAGQPGLRIDSGLHAGSEVSPFYDSMLAKVIGHGATRAQALAHARDGLGQLRIEGLRTNAGMLKQVLAHPAFEGVLATDFLDRHFPVGVALDEGELERHRLAVALAWLQSQPVTAPVWSTLRGFRVTEPAGAGARSTLRIACLTAASPAQETVLLRRGQRLGLLGSKTALAAQAGDDAVQVFEGERPVASVRVTRALVNGVLQWFSGCEGQGFIWSVDHGLARTEQAGPGSGEASNELSAALPGRVSELLVRLGDMVKAGDPVMTLEAMKLYHALEAPCAGRVAELPVKVGDIVGQGQRLMRLEVQPESEQAPSASA